MFSQLISLWKIPYGPLRLVIAAAPHNAAARVLVLKFFGPLPHIPDEVHYAKRACTLRVSVDRIWSAHRTALVWRRNCGGIPRISPWVDPSIRSLGCILPLPLMRQTLPGPARVGSRIFQRHPCYWLVIPTGRINSVAPLAEKVQIILGMVVGRIKKFFELSIRHRILVDPEWLHMHGMIVKAPRRILPRILHIDADVIESFNL